MDKKLEKMVNELIQYCCDTGQVAMFMIFPPAENDSVFIVPQVCSSVDKEQSEKILNAMDEARKAQLFFFREG